MAGEASGRSLEPGDLLLFFRLYRHKLCKTMQDSGKMLKWFISTHISQFKVPVKRGQVMSYCTIVVLVPVLISKGVEPEPELEPELKPLGATYFAWSWSHSDSVAPVQTCI